MITLIIVDCQNDFITGSMAVNKSRDVVDEIKKYIKKNKDDIEKVIFTLDWHPWNHMSFKRYGGQWPSHCVQFTPGACIEPKLLKLVQSLELNYECVLKGQIEEVEEYGAFSEISYESDQFGARFYLDIAEVNADTNIVICGIAGDYCVKETISNLLKGEISPDVFMKGIASIDDGSIIKKFVKENKLKVV